MSANDETRTWLEANGRALMAELARVRACLERYAARRASSVLAASAEDDPPQGEVVSHATDNEVEAHASLTILCESFGLTNFERDVLLMCAGVELDAEMASLCAAAHADASRAYPTFGLALAALPEPHWNGITPGHPLRRWRLIEMEAGETLTTSRLRIDERILYHLLGIHSLDERLQGLAEPVTTPSSLPFSYRAHAERIVRLWSQQEESQAWPVIQLSGDARGGRRALAAVACGEMGLRLHALRAADIPANSSERDSLARLWEREAILGNSGLLFEIEGVEQSEAACAFAERVRSPLLVTGSEPINLGGRSVVCIEVNRPGASEQQALWENALGPLAAGLNGDLERVVAQFPFDVMTIQETGRVLRREGLCSTDGRAPGSLLWEACRAQARPRLEGRAQRIETAATWDDIVLPEAQTQALHEITIHVRQRERVYESWGFAERGPRGLGITALFAGPSGTGKTLAAEVIANELHLDLYRIDLSQVVSKYIGETEKNLRHIFEAAEQGGAVLLFDEADALFGKRSDVKDSHDRFANIEVSYLLQRMESYKGLAILTTNQRTALDTAFLRRLRFIINFPFPDAALRARIWQRIFPPRTPTDGLDVNKLSRLNMTGGNIRNIALGAAFMAAEAGEPVRMRHLLSSTRNESNKLDKALTEAEIGGWV